jgi:4-amino-4-deoxy-L-arabinose transferase-like glycosyltransferase
MDCPTGQDGNGVVMLGKTLPRDTFVFIAILLAALALRLILLDDAPPGLRYDEVQNYVMVKRVLSGDRPLYFAESWGHEPLYHYVQALALSIAGESDWALRLPSVFFGLLKVIGTGLLARKLFGRPSGIIASSLAAISFWAIFYDRVGLRVGTTATFACFMVYFLWRGLERPINQVRHATMELLLAGVCMAAMFYVYISGRVGLGILVTYSLYLAVVLAGTGRLFCTGRTRLAI